MAKRKGKNTTAPKIENIDLRDFLEWETETHETGQGLDHYIHVDDVTMTEANLEGLARELTLTDLDAYCVERILTHYELYNNNKWSFSVRHYYYGDEIFKAKPVNLNEISTMIGKCLRLSDNEKIPFVLELEYGYLLDILKNRVWSIEVVQKADICFGSQYRKTKKVERYQEYTLPVCVVIDIPEGLTLIDGYHRFLSVQKDKFPVVVGK